MSRLEFQNNDLVFYQHGGKIMSGGYTVNSILMNSGQPLLNSYYGGSKTLERQNSADDDADDDADDTDDDDDDDAADDADDDADDTDDEDDDDAADDAADDADDDAEKTRRNKHFDNLAVPVGIFYIHNNHKSEYDDKLQDHNNYKQCNMLSDDIYDKLFELASFKQSTNKNKDNKVKKNTKKNNKQNINNENVIKKNKTKRNKKD
jgi:hypothetical protein